MWCEKKLKLDTIAENSNRINNEEDEDGGDDEEDTAKDSPMLHFTEGHPGIEFAYLKKMKHYKILLLVSLPEGKTLLH